jgi:hypothetical protein
MSASIREFARALRGESLPAQSPLAYAFAALCIGLALLAHMGVLQIVDGVTPSILYNPAIFIGALVGGAGPGYLAAALGLVFIWLTDKMRVVEDPMLHQAIGWSLYLATAVLIVFIAQCYRWVDKLGRSAGQARAVESAPGKFAALRPVLGHLAQRIPVQPKAAYLFALACIVLASGIRLGFAMLGGNVLPLVSYYPAILIAALAGGTGPGLFAMLASLAVISAEFPGPLLSFDPPGREDGISLSLYVFACLLSIWFAERHRQGSAREHGKSLQIVTSLLVAIAAILVTTLGLMAIDSYLDADHLVLGYLLPTVVIAMHYGGTLAVVTSFASSVAAAYFLFPPKFSFYVSAPEHLAELGLFLVLAFTASKAVAVLTDDARERLRT